MARKGEVRHPKEHIEAAQRRFPGDEKAQYGFLEGLRYGKEVERAAINLVNAMNGNCSDVFHKRFAEMKHALAEREEKRNILGL